MEIRPDHNPTSPKHMAASNRCVPTLTRMTNPLKTDAEVQSPYRPAKPLPYELREHVLIYFEEELCS